MAKKKMALCTPIPEKELEAIKEYCDITICGELKHGKGNVTEEMTKEECMGNELIVLGDEYAGTDTINAWVDAGMKFIGVAKGTPVTVDHDAIVKAGLDLTYTPGRNAVAVAEFCIGLMIASTRNLALSCVGLQKGEHLGAPVDDIYNVPEEKNVTWGPLDENHPYTDYGIGFELYGKKLGIAGYGAIGREVAKRAMAFGMEILAYDPYMPKEAVEATGAEYVDLDTMLSQSDIVSIHIPATPETHHLFNKETIASMKDGAYLINPARGALVDLDAVAEALTSGKLAGAAMDAFEVEPLPLDSPILKCENIVLTPHTGAETKESYYNVSMTTAKDIIKVIKGEEPEHCVNK